MSDLKPMDVGEILDGALTIYRRHFRLLVQLGIIALWLPVAVSVYIQLSGGPQQHIVLAVFTALVQYLASLLLTAGAIRIISDSYLGRSPRLGDAIALGAAEIWPLVVVGLGKAIVVGLCVLLPAIGAAIFIPALARGWTAVAVLVGLALVFAGFWLVIFVLCGYAVTTQVVVLEELGSAFDAFGRSWDLTRGFKRKVLATAVVAFLIFSLPAMMVGGLRGVFLERSPAAAQALTVVSALLPIIMTPLLACVFTLMYYDLRVRREAFDLQVLGQQLGIV